MNSKIIFGMGFVFIFVGLVFIIISFFIKKGEGMDLVAGYNSSDEEYRKKNKQILSKMCSLLFFIVGFITALFGLFSIAFHKEATNEAIHIMLLIYLVLLTISTLVFSISINILIKKGKK
jgi:uncharacterized membrane protein